MENRNLIYEQENIGYDLQYPEGGIKCRNYKLCESILPPDCWEWGKNYLCINCDNFGWNELSFIDCDEDCCICLNYCINKIKFPTNCGHYFCVKCCENLLFWDETRYHLSPEPYGCPPCPNGCINPIKGKQCYCEEYSEIQDIWEIEKPNQWKEWNEAENLSIEQSEDGNSSFSKGICPLCRKKYNK